MFLPDKVAFTIFGIEIAWYGILIAGGIMAALALALSSAKKYGWTSDDIYDVSIICVPAGIVGARLYYVAFEWEQYSSNLLSIFNIRGGGLAVYGGIIGGAIAAAIYCRVKKKNVFELLDIAMPSVAVGQAIGRWGNFFNQEVFGKIVEQKSMQWFPLSVFIEQTQTFHYATFFYESVWCALIAVVIVTQRKKFKHVGDATLIYLILYGFERMIVEGVRTDTLLIGNVRVSQALSALMLVGAIGFIVFRKIKNKNNPNVKITNKANLLYKA